MAKTGAYGGALEGPCGEGRPAEWLHVYNRMAAMLRRTHAKDEALAADRDRLKMLVESQHTREKLLQVRIQQMRRREAKRRRAEKAAADALLGVKELEARRYQKLAELTETDMEDLRTCIAALAAENTELKKKTEEG